jgi:hypothetical protein
VGGVDKFNSASNANVNDETSIVLTWLKNCWDGLENVTDADNVTGCAGDNPWALVSGMELQDTYANVTGNIIYVNNTAGYDQSYCAYGISYSQSTSGGHLFNIQGNTVTVVNGKYAVYVISSSGSVVSNNKLVTTVYSGNDAVYINRRTNTVSGNY